MNHTQACQTAGITYRQLDHWTRKGYLKPENDNHGSGSKRAWSEAEVRVATRIARLLLAGFELKTAVKLARRDHPVTTLADGITLVYFDGEWDDYPGTFVKRDRPVDVGASQV